MTMPENVKSIFETLQQQIEGLESALNGIFDANANTDTELIEYVTGMQQSLGILLQLVENPTPKESVMLTSNTMQMGYFLQRVKAFCDAAENYKNGRMAAVSVRWASTYVTYQLANAESEALRLGKSSGGFYPIDPPPES